VIHATFVILKCFVIVFLFVVPLKVTVCKKSTCLGR